MSSVNPNLGKNELHWAQIPLLNSCNSGNQLFLFQIISLVAIMSKAKEQVKYQILEACN